MSGPFIAQHQSDGDQRIVVGAFRSLDDAEEALDQHYHPASWQTIRDEATGRRWWRTSGAAAWRQLPTRLYAYD